MSFLSWLGLKSDKQPLEVGATAPDASVFDVESGTTSLSGHYGPDFTLVYFYPKADTPGCTRQACSLRDQFEVLKQRGVQVIGISADMPDAQKNFGQKFQLPFVLLADPARNAGRAFGVPMIAGLFRRQAFLIRKGRIVWRDLSASTGEQAADVLKAIESA